MHMNLPVSAPGERPKQLVRVIIMRGRNDIFADYILNLVNMQAYKQMTADAHPALMLGYVLHVQSISEAEASEHSEITRAHKRQAAEISA